MPTVRLKNPTFQETRTPGKLVTSKGMEGFYLVTGRDHAVSLSTGDIHSTRAWIMTPLPRGTTIELTQE